MKIRLLGMTMVMLLGFCPAYAAGPDFGGLDRDESGTLEKAEIESAAPEVLKKYDLNGDGALDRAEFKAAGGSAIRFDEIDRDKSGRIDPDEFRKAASRRFEQIDSDRNDRIDDQEWSKRRNPVENPLLFFYF